jgi:hypothetical protein
VVTVRVVTVAVVCVCSFHEILPDASSVAAYLRRPLTSAGATMSPALFAQLLRV